MPIFKKEILFSFFFSVTKFDYGDNARPLSVQSRDAYSQTESVDDELFLKDVIIRLPSAKISNNNYKVNENAEFNCMLNCPDNDAEKLDPNNEVFHHIQFFQNLKT